MKKSKERQEKPPVTVQQLVAAMMALGNYTGNGNEAEHQAEAERLGGMDMYRMFLSNALLGCVETEAMLNESVSGTFEQLRGAHQQSLIAARVFDDPGKLLGFLRWRTLRIEGPLREIAQRQEVGPLPLAAAHAAEGLQQLLGVCAEGQDFQQLLKTSPAALKQQMKDARQSFTYAIGNIDIMLNLLAQTEDLFSK